MAELRAVEMDAIALVALEYPDLCSKTHGVNVWSMVGGWHGLRSMHANTNLLLALAWQASAWNKQASKIALEAMRRDLLLLRRSVVRSLYHQALAQSLELRSCDVHGVAKAYHHMAELLLDLYRHSPSRLYTHLETAVWPTPIPNAGAS